MLWQSGAASPVDLHPGSFDLSEATGTSGRDQVGSGIPPTGGSHALLWRGSADSVVDLHPPGFIHSEAHGTNGEEQVGIGMAPGVSGHALLWRGSAASVLDLHVLLPPGFGSSIAFSIDATGDIVGVASVPEHWGPSHAILWKRNAPKPGTSHENTVRC